MKKKLTQLRWLATMIIFVTAMAMPKMAWAEGYDENGFGSDGSYQPAKQVSETYHSELNGTHNGYYAIENAGQLYWFADKVNNDNANYGSANAVLTAHIIVPREKEWTPISNYSGTFDGKGCTVGGLNFRSTEDVNDVGLFGVINTGGTVKNVGIVNSYFSGDMFIGGVCGRNSGTIENCYNTGEVSGKQFVGGVCGINNSGTIENCYNTGEVSGYTTVGGVCGANGGTIINSYYNSTVYSGDAVGSNDFAIAFENVLGKTEAHFNSGEVCYLLNNGKTDGSQVWYQTLSGSGEGYPNLNKDTENRTVYAGYRHSETTPYCSNTQSNIPSGYGHLHAYNSDASDEANGNHDKSYQGVFNWTDNDDKTDVTVTATFTCSVCRKVETPDVTAVHDNEHTNTPAACTEVGYHYFKTSHAFEGAIFTDSYTQTVPALGHYMNIITFKEYDKIYSNKCQRENCGYIGYYATSDGSVKAKYEDGVYKVPFLCLYDAKAYDSKAEYTVESLTYQRTFSHDKWVAVYVPFAIDCSLLPDYMEMAIVNNFHEYEQTDGSYNVVLEVKRMTSGTIPALTPCVMRLKTEPASATEKEIQLSNVPFSAAADNYIDCSSVTRYYKFTGSLTGKSGFDEASDFVPLNGDVVRASGDTNLEPQRWFLTATNRGSTTPLPVGLQRIAIRVMGDNEGEGGGTITSIDTLHLIEGLYTESGRIVYAGEFRIYDLLGRDVTRLNGSLCGVYIVKTADAAQKVVVK